MATDPNVILTVALDGGAPSQTTGVAATLAQTVQLSAVNKSTWSVGSATRWEIYDYPDGFALPAGWTEAADGSYYALGIDDPASFAATPWGKYVCRVIARNGGESQIIVSVESPSGLEDIAAKEGSEFGGAIRRWVAAMKSNLRVIETDLASAGALNNPLSTASQEINDSGTFSVTATTGAYLGSSTGNVNVEAAAGDVTISGTNVEITGTLTNNGSPIASAGTDALTSKLACRARMPAQLTIPDTLVTDGGVTAVAGDRILLDSLTTQASRGPYVAQAPGNAWTRASDFNATADIANGALVLVVEGTDAGKLYKLDQLGATLGTDALTFSQVGGSAVYDVEEGATHAEIVAALAAAATAGRPCLFGPGDFELDSPVTLADGYQIRGAGYGLTTIKPSASWATAGDDSRANALFMFTPTLPGAATTLSAIAPERANAIEVASEAGFSAGDYLYIQGVNPILSEATGLASALPLQELCRVLSTAAGIIRLRWPLRQHHADTIAVTKITAPLSDAWIEDVTLDGDDTAACGVALNSSLGFRADRIGLTGFTRAGLDLLGDFGTRVGTVHDLGGCNALLLSDSSIDAVFGDGQWTYDPEGARYAATGHIRAKIALWGRPTNVVINPGVLGRGCLSLRKSGGHHVRIVGYQSIDMDPSEVVTRTASDPEDGYFATPNLGTGYHGGFDVIGFEEFGEDISIDGTIHIVNHNHASSPNTSPANGPMVMAAYFHDERITLSGAVRVHNQAAGTDYDVDGSTDGYLMYGVMVKDAYVLGGEIEIRGVDYAFMTENVYAPCTSNIKVTSTPGLGANTAVAFHLNHGSGGGPRFGRVTLGNPNAVWRFGSAAYALAANTHDGEIVAEELIVNEYIYRGPIMLGYVNADTTYGIGEIAELDPTSAVNARELRLYTGTGAPVVICGGATAGDVGQNTAVPFMALPAGQFATLLCSTAAVAMGDVIVSASGSKEARTGAMGQVLGRALSAKAAGSTGAVTVGPAPAAANPVTKVSLSGTVDLVAAASWAALTADEVTPTMAASTSALYALDVLVHRPSHTTDTGATSYPQAVVGDSYLLTVASNAAQALTFDLVDAATEWTLDRIQVRPADGGSGAIDIEVQRDGLAADAATTATVTASLRLLAGPMAYTEESVGYALPGELHRYMPDDVTSGGGVTTAINDQTGPADLTVSGTAAEPAADANFNNELSIDINANTVSALHDFGAGLGDDLTDFCVVILFRPDVANAIGYVFSTHTDALADQMVLLHYNDSNAYWRKTNPANDVVTSQVGTAQAIVVNGNATSFEVWRKVAGGALTLIGENSAAEDLGVARAIRLWNRADAAGGLVGQWAGTLIGNTKLTGNAGVGNAPTAASQLEELDTYLETWLP